MSPNCWHSDHRKQCCPERKQVMYMAMSRAHSISKLEIFLPALFLFLISLQSFYVPALGGSALTAGGALGIAALAITRRSIKTESFPEGVCLYLAALLILTFAACLQDVLIHPGDFSRAKANFGVVLFALLSIFWVPIVRNRPQLLGILKLVILAHLLFFGFQLLYYFTTGQYIDYLQYFGLE